MDVTAFIDRSCEAWTEPDPSRPAGRLGAAWMEGATCTGPSVHAEGAGDVLGRIAGMQAGLPGATVSRTGAVDAHHGAARFACRVVRADGTASPGGLDGAFLSADGARIERIIGLFGPPEHLAESRAA